MAINWPDISQNQLFHAGLGLLGAGLRPQNANPFQAASHGLMYGSMMDRQAKQDEREEAEAERRKRLEEAWGSMFGIPGAAGGSPAPATGAMTEGPLPGPNTAVPMPGMGPIDLTGGMRGPQMASASPDMAGMGGPGMPPGGPAAPAGAPPSNPLLAGLPPQAMPLLAALGPEAGAPFLLQQMARPKPERRIITGADGFNYYADTGERVLPGVEAKRDKPPTGYRYGADGNLEVDPNWLETELRLRREGRNIQNINVDNVGKTLSPGQKKIDETYAADYADFVLGGGYADAAKNLDQIGEVIGRLRQGEGLTGGFGARLPDWARAYVDPEGLDVQQLTEEVIQRNLREVLGAQFTEKEGERLISRAYDSRLSEEKNLERLERLYGAMREGLEARREAAEYFEANETMKGYKGAKRMTIRDLEKALEEPKRETMDFSSLSPQELLAVDASELSSEELDALMKAMDDAGL